jgi:hypothetical protein
MTTLCKTYSSEIVARRAVDALMTAGVPERDIRVLTGCRVHDVRRERVGAFAGSLRPDARVGTFAGVERLRRQAAGSFARDPDCRRKGSFADVDQDTIGTFDAGEAHSHVTGDPEVRRLLRSARVPADAIRRAVTDLHSGRAVVLAEVAEIAPSDTRTRLDDVARVA